MIRFAGTAFFKRPLPRIAEFPSFGFSDESRRAELAAKTSGRTMEVVDPATPLQERIARAREASAELAQMIEDTRRGEYPYAPEPLEDGGAE